jgi:hypothetical protein
MIPGFISKKSKLRLNLLGWYQILGGISGLSLTIWLLTQTRQFNALVVILFLLALTLYGFSVCCGILLFGHRYKAGLKLSIVNQVLQVVSFAFIGYAYLYSSGAAINLGVAYSSSEPLRAGFNFDFGLMSKWQFSIAADDHSFRLTFNVLAIYLVYFIDKLSRTIEGEKLNRQLADAEPEI